MQKNCLQNVHMILLQCNTLLDACISPSAVFYVKETRMSAVYCIRHKMRVSVCMRSWDFSIYYFETVATLNFKTAQRKDKNYNVPRDSAYIVGNAKASNLFRV